MRWMCVLQSFTDSWLHVIMFLVLNYVRGVEIGVWCFYSCVMKKNNVVNKQSCFNWKVYPLVGKGKENSKLEYQSKNYELQKIECGLIIILNI